MSTDFTDHGQRSVGPAVGPADERPPAEESTLVPPATGDAEIDRVLDELAAAQTGSLAARVAAGEQAQAALQSRLRDLGGA
jgi:hypothetical protein